jgi:hypothetical protein
VAQPLELAQLAQSYGVADVDHTAGRIDADVDSYLAAPAQVTLHLLAGNDLGDAALEQVLDGIGLPLLHRRQVDHWLLALKKEGHRPRPKSLLHEAGEGGGRRPHGSVVHAQKAIYGEYDVLRRRSDLALLPQTPDPAARAYLGFVRVDNLARGHLLNFLLAHGGKHVSRVTDAHREVASQAIHVVRSHRQSVAQADGVAEVHDRADARQLLALRHPAQQTLGGIGEALVIDPQPREGTPPHLLGGIGRQRIGSQSGGGLLGGPPYLLSAGFAAVVDTQRHHQADAEVGE